MSEVENTELDLNGEMIARREKLAQLRERGNPFPNTFRREDKAADLHQKYNDVDGEELKEKAIPAVVAGRVMLRRVMGKATFITIQDVSGQIQLYVARDNLPEGEYQNLISLLDLGDIVGAKGTLFKTKTGELTVRASDFQLLTKALRPLPNKHTGLTDQETRYRQRYLDLIANEESRRAFVIRSKVVSGIRQFFLDKDFIEVETPMLQVIPGGAAARPFVTHHNALDVDMYLRIAPELYLKRLVVGGFERVFELNRNFRNEGVSVRHNPEFTMLEFYQAYADYRDLMDLTEALFQGLAREVLGSPQITYQGVAIDLGQPFARLAMTDAIRQYAPQHAAILDDSATLAAVLREQYKQKADATMAIGSLHTLLFEEAVEHQLVQPTFITAYPSVVSPLARRNDETPDICDRFELFIGGREVANGFSELNDAEDQAERFRAQAAAFDAGDDEAMHYDADYIRALEYGMPPTAGEGIGIDRLVMLLTDAPSIRDVLLFPHMRPE